MNDLGRALTLAQPEGEALKTAELLVDKAAHHGRNRREVFRDFIDVAFNAIFARWEPSAERRAAREAAYMEVVGRYASNDTSRGVPRVIFPNLLAITATQLAQHEPGDFLGQLATRLEVLSSRDGQFFTPMSISRLTSALILPDQEISDRVGSGQVLKLHEPACGSGGMILAVAGRIRLAGGDPERMLAVHAVDISPLCFRMCAVQLTLASIPAEIFLGNGLDPEVALNCRDSALTPAAMGLRRAGPSPEGGDEAGLAGQGPL